MDELIDRIDFWKHGPKFLLLPHEDWPKQPMQAAKSTEVSEEQATSEFDKELDLLHCQLRAERQELAADRIAHAMAAAEEPPIHDPLGLERLLKDCSSLQTVRGVITRIQRLAAKAKGEAHRLTPPNGKEITFADNLLIRYVQPVSYTHLTLPTNREV